MDGQRFDDLTRSLAAGATRRRALRLLTGGAVAALGAALGRRRVGAQGCAQYGRVCAASGCCTTLGAECRRYPNGHRRCVCPAGSSRDAAADACVCPDGGLRCITVFNCNPFTSTEGLCCPEGQQAFGCCQSATAMGTVGCCTVGTDCPNDAGGPTCANQIRGLCVFTE